MSTLDELLGLNPEDPQTKLATELVRNDTRLLSDLVDARHRAGYSQQDVADRLGIAQPSVAAFERYDNDPKLSTIRRYALAVGARITHAVANTREPERPGLHTDRCETLRASAGTASATATGGGRSFALYLASTDFGAAFNDESRELTTVGPWTYDR